VDEVIARTGAVLAGRRVYEVGECSDPRRAGCSTDAGRVRISSSPSISPTPLWDALRAGSGVATDALLGVTA
jgi:hypothetical protein